jgi:hypothetical protein
MPNKNIVRGPAAGGAPADFFNAPNANGVYIDGSTGALVLGTGTSGVASKTVLDNAVAGQTIVSPVITGDAIGGVVVAKTVNFVADATSVTHTATIAIPAGATLLDILVSAGVLWGAAAAVLKVGDTADDDGYFIGVDLKATDLLVGEVISVSGSTGNWGGKNGAYLVAATGRRGPAATNFGAHYPAGSNILATVTVTTPAVTTGRTYLTVFYAVGQVAAVVKA